MNRLMIVIRTQTVLIYLKGLIVVAKVDLVVMDKRAKISTNANFLLLATKMHIAIIIEVLTIALVCLDTMAMEQSA